MDLDELCQLWRYQNNESRVTEMLKQNIQGYDNNNPFNISNAQKQRNKWTDEIKHSKIKSVDPLQAIKEEYLEDLLHPQKIYLKPRKADYEIIKQPYGKNHPSLKHYEDATKNNLQPNIIDFQMYNQQKADKQKEAMKHVDYVNTFYQKFGQFLVKASPEYWKLLLFDILKKIVQFKDASNEDLGHQINTLLPEESAIKYLVTFRKELCEFLQQSKFLDGEVNLKFDETAKKQKRKNEKQKTLKWMQVEEVSDSMDFLKLKDSELVQKVPNLKRFDHSEYIQFRMEPLPRIRNIQIQRIKVSDCFIPKYAKCFQSEFLNTAQSYVYNHAYNSNENMLVCAPTGAGKTNIATLTILQAIKQVKNQDDVRIVYISPMKALANELVEKFSVKLPHLKTRQSTGDIQLSQRELATTNILITTPEKWDVTTRKSTGILQNIHLIIFDQVHLLNDERGWVIQSIVARMFRTIERTQKHIRLVALSATLPNYFDVADFLKVNREKGMFYFDQNYRPVPLTINFIGVKNPRDSNNNMSHKRRQISIYNQKCYDITMSHLKNDKQVLIFVHSRKQTVRYCQWILDYAKSMKDQYLLKSTSNILKNYPNLKDRNLKKYVPGSVGFHHAGMVRADRNAVEKMFQKGEVKILLATATLAWGVNLPAYAVIIKGTDIYDPTQSESRDLSILDVQQMFGRAGRPQYDVVGEATLMSDHSKVNHYMGALTNSVAIESKFLAHIKQSLNAEITSGTVTNQDQAFDWLKYTFLAVRLKKCPEVYGCRRGANETQKQIHYDEFIRETVNSVLRELDTMRLIRLDHKSLSVSSTELGRITSHYYIKCETMGHFCNALHIYSSDNVATMKKKFDYKTDLQILNILAECKEFESIKPRPEQMEELKELVKYWFLEEQPDFMMKKDKTSENLEEGAIIETPQKVILLLQGYLRDVTYENFSLINDTQYVVQNTIRLLRCMLDLCSKKNQAENVKLILNWCKYVENRVYKFYSPLKQFTKFSYSGYNVMRTKKHMDGFLSNHYYEDFQKLELQVGEYLQAKDDTDRWALLQLRKDHPKVRELKRFCEYLPFFEVSYTIKPIAQTILKIDVILKPCFVHNPKWHGGSQIVWIMMDDEQELLHSETVSIDKQFIEKSKQVKTSFYIRYKGNADRNYKLTVTSDKWLTDENEQYDINLETLGIELESTPFTELLNIEPLGVTALKNPVFESLYTRFKFFNPIQTQLFFSLYQDTKNILIGAPTGSGKTIMSQLAILNLMKTSPEKKCVYIAPLKSLVKQRLKDWIPRFKKLKKSVVQLSGDFTPDIETLKKADIIITTPEKWDGITRSKERQYARQVGLVIFDQIHLLGQDRGAVIEVIVSRMNKQNKVRMIGLSTAMANGTDVAEWFGTNQYGFFNFRPTVRPVPIEIHFQGFSEKHYCPRMATMNKPAFNHIKKFSDNKPVIIFVSSRRQTRLTANDLISFSQMEYKDSCPYVRCKPEIIQKAIQVVHDQYLKQTLNFGIVMHHAGLDNHDREICEDLFVNNKVQIMIATSTLAWGVNFPARLVIIKGTQFFDPKSHKYVDFQATDILQMIGRAGRPQFDDKGVAMVYVESSKKNFYRKFLNDPFPIESSLLEQLQDHVNAEIARGEIKNEQECIEWITWSFMFRRVLKNPNYYGLSSASVDDIKNFLRDLVARIFKNLKNSKCIDIVDDDSKTVLPTELGFISSNYYLRHQTVNKFQKQLQAGLLFKDLLRILSDAEQFKQTPLRHNEDIHNKQLSDIAPFKAKNFSSPQDKTFLLLQMHFYHLPFPIRDYVNDCSLILDSSSRVVMGMIEVAKQKQLFDITQNSIYIQQCIYQGVGCNLPFITYPVWRQMSKKFHGLAGIVESIGKGERSKQYEEIMSFLHQKVIQIDGFKLNKILTALKSFPRVRMGIKIKNFDSETMAADQKQIQQGGEALVLVELTKQNSEIDNRIIVQKHKKIKDVTWWVLIGDTNNNLLAIKKVSIKKKVTLKLQIDVPERLKGTKVHVYLMADSYIGLDQAQQISFTN